MAADEGADAAALDDLLELAAAWSAVSRVLERALTEIDLGLAQALVLLTIASAPPPLLISALANRLVQAAQSMTAMLDRLEQAGWARRVSHELLDRRAIRVELTEAGKAKVEEAQALLTAAAEKVMASLDATQQAGLREGVVALYGACRNQPGVRLPSLPNVG